MARDTVAATIVLGVILLISASATAGVMTADPIGDTFLAQFGSGSDQHDVVNTQACVANGDLLLTVEFADPIAPPSELAANSFDGFIDLDTDEDVATSGMNSQGVMQSNLSFFSEAFGGPASGLGIEYYVDLGSETVGQVAVINAATGLVTGQAALSVAGSAFTAAIPLSLIGGDDGRLHYGVIIGDFDDPSDMATGTSIPELDVTFAAFGYFLLARNDWRMFESFTIDPLRWPRFRGQSKC